jgi:hypothetical protein
MTTVLNRPARNLGSVPNAAGLASLGTAALHSALERRGCATAGTRVELVRAGDRTRVVLYVRPSDPWRATLAAMTDVMRVVRLFDPAVRLADGCFEAIEAPE